MSWGHPQLSVIARGALAAFMVMQQEGTGVLVRNSVLLVGLLLGALPLAGLGRATLGAENPNEIVHAD